MRNVRRLHPVLSDICQRVPVIAQSRSPFTPLAQRALRVLHTLHVEEQTDVDWEAPNIANWKGTWITNDNLDDKESRRALLRGGKLVKTQNASEETVPPGLVYLTNSAFCRIDQKAWSFQSC